MHIGNENRKRKKLKNGESFYYYNAKSNKLTYKATVIDLATEEDYDSKYSIWKNNNVASIEDDFKKYQSKDGKSAAIVFLISDFMKLESTISFDDIKFFGNFGKPKQRNLVPYYTIDDNKINKSNNLEILSEKEDSTTDYKASKNQILYGPPGTGKTFHTINKALEICYPESREWGGRKEEKKEFEKLIKEGRIVFTTFHQSMSYEDFIEGIKPIENSSQILYETRDGIFKKIVKEALENYELSNLNSSEIIKSKAPFDMVFDLLKGKVENAFLNNESSEITNEYTKGLVINLSNSFFSIIGITGNSIRMMTRTGSEQNTMTKDTLERIYDNPEQLKDIIKGGMSTYYEALINLLLSWKVEIIDKAKKVERKNYVLIIDEINRGNVSQIFGELITLIEDSKRIGETEALQVVLPYSNDSFSIPPNVYIIGTMNTADRSVEALDTALRRRFSFIEMLPNASLLPTVANIDLKKLLLVLNERIEVLVDRDHTIGHAFFINSKSLKDIQHAFANKVIPLLQEYFYGDYKKIELVIGSLFFKEKKEVSKVTFAVQSEDVFEGNLYDLKNVTDMDETSFIEALKGIGSGIVK